MNIAHQLSSKHHLIKLSLFLAKSCKINTAKYLLIYLPSYLQTGAITATRRA